MNIIFNAFAICIFILFLFSLGVLVGAFHGWVLDFVKLGPYIDSGASAFGLDFTNTPLWKVGSFIGFLFSSISVVMNRNLFFGFKR